MLWEILTGENKTQESHPQLFKVFFSTRTPIIIQSPPLDEEEIAILKLLFSFQHIEPISSYDFKQPIQKQLVILEKEDLDWFYQLLSGLKNSSLTEPLPFIYNRLSHSALSILKLPDNHNKEEIVDFIHYLFSHQLFSYQMLYTLFLILENKIDLKNYISKRNYQILIKETQEKEEILQEKNWQMLVVFITNYYYNTFLRKLDNPLWKNFFDFLEKLKLFFLKKFFEKNRLSQIIRLQIEPKDMVRFFATIPDDTIALAFDALEWENFKGLVSKNTYQRVLELIWLNHKKEEKTIYEMQILEKCILFKIKHQYKPPLFYLKESYQLKTKLNLLFDRLGPMQTAIFLENNPFLLKTYLHYLTSMRKQWISNYLEKKIKKQKPSTQKEIQNIENKARYHIALFLEFPEIAHFF